MNIRTQNIVIFVKQCLVMQKNRKVRDHDHYTGKFRGDAHSIYNLRYLTQKDFPVFFNNCTTYDFNLMINELAKEFRSELHCITLNGEQFMSFSIPIKKRSMLTLRLPII